MSSFSGVLYIGVTNNLKRRVYEHKQELVEGFSKKYKCKKLVYFEEYKDINQAIAREKQLKNWNRKKKDRLIIKLNPDFKDLSDSW
ncbi:MAG: Excinuclease ABC C subunit domain protein [Candidatus Roizmanbacteria bacterium GW2011_GWC2_37_13]|uniref:Excinuclease ABC C subunit domain protein n=1 Tax=Candidatus Roizmanbacteria bacterium GW2011_GWC2_37_13 TaxID=1618486 RepID=A0A0G0INT9_9BACT|nr:MAG: Excinuclease ABC C subunit domain protein [Candidatus Roizmanbacteria bacterium GW2011_GWC1_37_12]KKQ25854.1 MAG: Excinuclease ABC C subunit domain protein [Candidatus Roizmanbacteria bacterium GW2011_GWC2_37_13]